MNKRDGVTVMKAEYLAINKLHRYRHRDSKEQTVPHKEKYQCIACKGSLKSDTVYLVNKISEGSIITKLPFYYSGIRFQSNLVLLTQFSQAGPKMSAGRKNLSL